jgi:CO/xanthine dehydrogenase Mo-binding subunit
MRHEGHGWDPKAPASVHRVRTSHMRATASPQSHFASEQFIDELALATRTDPIEFRLRHITDSRDAEVLKAAAKAADWQPRPALRAIPSGDTKLVGRGVAMAQKSGTTVAIVANVEVDRASGQVRPLRFVIAHDCGLIVNPEGLRRTIEGNLLQTTSRTIWEEVTFDRNHVTSVDWKTYPISDIAMAPDAIDIVLINRPDTPSGGAGEATCRAVAGALANAVFDATGVRFRRAPLTPERVKAALTRA